MFRFYILIYVTDHNSKCIGPSHRSICNGHRSMIYVHILHSKLCHSLMCTAYMSLFTGHMSQVTSFIVSYRIELELSLSIDIRPHFAGIKCTNHSKHSTLITSDKSHS